MKISHAQRQVRSLTAITAQSRNTERLFIVGFAGWVRRVDNIIGAVSSTGILTLRNIAQTCHLHLKCSARCVVLFCMQSNRSFWSTAEKVTESDNLGRTNF